MSRNFGFKGLTEQQVENARIEHGWNKIETKQENLFVHGMKSLVKEPMVILLFVASLVYFLSGEVGDGLFLVGAIILVSAISLYQDFRSENALKKLSEFTEPFCTVIRDGLMVRMKSEEIVIGDNLVVQEGVNIAADGEIIHSNDFAVNESILTGESFSVSKNKEQENRFVFTGTTVTSGLAIIVVTAIGEQTKLGRIGQSLTKIKHEKTPLEVQINRFVKNMVILGAIVFLLVLVINYFMTYNFLDSLLKSLTLAMSILPEEIPVAFTTFMALGAWRLMKMGIVVKQMKTIETLGSATVICTDKTGTITENRMILARLFTLDNAELVHLDSLLTTSATELIRISMFASEPIPFDPMEIAIHQAYKEQFENDERPDFKMIHEYPLGGKPPMMTHIFENESGIRIVATKGAPEAIIAVSNVTDEQKIRINQAIEDLAQAGFRVLGVAETKFESNEFLAKQQDYKFKFKGIIAFYDPPKANIQAVFEHFYQAGIDVKIVTGDNGKTTSAIAKQVGFRGYNRTMTGAELMLLSDQELQAKVMDIHIFSRMFPEAKLRIINALKAKDQIVAMTGDGVNDGPALKAAHIGIAMGKKGTEIAKQAASLVLIDDDLERMVDAIRMGRKIYFNLKKAIQYIISIHIPIILTVFIPLVLGWIFPNILSPVHVVFLELIMGPTCSIIYENEPVEDRIMHEKPRLSSLDFFSWKELWTSLVQGLMITVGVLLSYQYAVQNGGSEELVRTMVFVSLISANIFLTLVNRSFFYSIFTTIRYKNNLVILIIGITVAITALLLFVNPLTAIFEFTRLDLRQLSIALGFGFISVIWYEFVKLWKRAKTKKS
jgi:Ca2+-transporting ATPase